MFLFSGVAFATYNCSLGGSYADQATCNANCLQTANCSASSTICIFNTSTFGNCTFDPTAATYSCPLSGGSACNGSHQCSKAGTCTYIALPTITISANPSTIVVGNSSTLTWSSTNATSCTASVAWSGGKAVNGSQPITPASIGSINYVLQCTGPGGSVIKTATVTVNALPVPTVTISAAPNPITAGSPTTLTWTTANATSCWSSGGNASDGWQNASQAFSNGLHTRNVYPIPPKTTYSIECWNASGVSSGIRSVTVNVNCTTTNLCSHAGASCTASDCGTSINNPARCDQRNNCTGLLTTVPLSSCSGCANISVPCPACPLKTDVWKEIPPQ